MEKIYVVCWGTAAQDDSGNSKAFSGVHGAYKSKESAIRGLVDCKEEFIDEIVNNLDFSEADREEVAQSLQIYGSESEEYFEIDYFNGDTPEEIYITLTETNFCD